MKETSDEIRGSMRLLPYMGVIAVVAEAEKLGFYNGHPDWVNLGQGQPEVGEMPGAPSRITKLEFQPIDHAYGPVHGTVEFREAVAAHLNRLHRKGKKSQYTAGNIAVCSGGRLALARAVFALAPTRIGYLVPDYSAYEDLLGGQMPRIEVRPVFAPESNGFALTAAQLALESRQQDLRAFIVSNPCNPTGIVARREELRGWLEVARERDMALLVDEFYSHFIYDSAGRPGDGAVSMASEVDDVDQDPVLLFDGLTKSFRYPGWRVGWVAGPKRWIECFITAGSSMDGGPARIMQRGAIQVLEPARADQETQALRVEFARKRNLMVTRLKEMGLRFARESEGTFYCWVALDRLKKPFDTAAGFFHAALQRKVMTVPGYYFDVNPRQHRAPTGAFDRWMRFSFGPPHDAVKKGLDRLAEMLG